MWSSLSYPVVCTYLLPLETQSGLRCAHLCPRVHKELGEYSVVITSPGKVLFTFERSWERLEPPAAEAGLTEPLVLPPSVNQGERGCTWISVQSGAAGTGGWGDALGLDAGGRVPTPVWVVIALVVGVVGKSQGHPPPAGNVEMVSVLSRDVEMGTRG